jgi:hypothetical protein
LVLSLQTFFFFCLLATSGIFLSCCFVGFCVAKSALTFIGNGCFWGFRFCAKDTYVLTDRKALFSFLGSRHYLGMGVVVFRSPGFDSILSFFSLPFEHRNRSFREPYLLHSKRNHTIATSHLLVRSRKDSLLRYMLGDRRDTVIIS